MPHDWRDTLRLAGDLALLGIVVTLLSLPLLTAGAAVATGSYAIGHLLDEGRWPSFADCRRAFRRRLVPGLGAGPAVAAAIGLIVLDAAALRRGAVPGGTPVLAVVLAVAAFGAGFVALLAVRAGSLAPGVFRAALATAVSRPVATVAAVAILAVAALLAGFVHPVLVPVLAGYALFALHVAVRRLTAGSRPDLRPAAGAPRR
jgi:hypothetical protein